MAEKNYISYVNIKQGSKSNPRFSNGNTLPLVQRPFGFTSFVPQSDGAGNNWFYNSDHTTFEGIRITHQPSPWIGDHGAMIIHPQSVLPKRDFSWRWTSFDRESAVQMPHYMSFHLNQHDIDIEVTPTEYGGCVHVKFNREKDNYISVLPVKGECEFKFDAEKSLLYCNTDYLSGSRYEKCDAKSYFVFKFNKGDIDVSKTLIATGEENSEPGTEVSGANKGIHLYCTKDEITFTLAESYISYEQAELNLERDADFSSFEDLKKQNEEIWNSYLSRIKITSTEDRMKTFYSCMYRAFLFPRKAYEINAEGKKVHFSPATNKAEDGVRYTENGFWDTYRTVYPLFALIAKDEYKEMMEGYINDYKDSGWLPRWTSFDARNCMPSTLIDATIADAAVRGLLTGDLLKTAFEGMEKHANNKAPIPCYGREGCDYYLSMGYVPYDKHSESVNLTLDASYGDYCIGVVADLLGEKEKAQMYFKRSKNYANLFDKSTGFMTGKDSNGVFRPNLNPIDWNRDYTEAAAWQTTFAVQHDFEGLAELYGGVDKLIQKLDDMFAAKTEFKRTGYLREIHEMSELAAGKWGQCAISNQPSFHLPFIYAGLGHPEKTSYWVKRICDEGFSWQDDGFPGDEDNGTAAAWYIFATIGLYPLCPGKGEFVKFDKLADTVEF